MSGGQSLFTSDDGTQFIVDTNSGKIYPIQTIALPLQNGRQTFQTSNSDQYYYQEPTNIISKAAYNKNNNNSTT